MFEGLSDKLSGILDKLTRRGALTEEDVDAALREVRRALLEADVALEVVRALHRQGARPRRRRRGGQVGHARPDGRQDRPRRAGRDAGLGRRPDRSRRRAARADPDGRPAGLGQDDHDRQDRQAAAPSANGRKVLMASLDTRRPAARSSCACSASRPASTRCRSSPARRPCRSPAAPWRPARLGGYDVVILDTAGRTTIDEALMAEVGRGQGAPPTRTRCCSSPTR